MCRLGALFLIKNERSFETELSGEENPKERELNDYSCLQKDRPCNIKSVENIRTIRTNRMPGKKGRTNRNPSPATRFKKGMTGNPHGMKPGVVPKKEWKMHTRASIAEAFSRFMTKDSEELRIIGEDTTIPILDVIVARALLRDRLEGEMDNTERIMERTIGKIPIETRQELTGAEGAPLIPPQIIFNPVVPAGTVDNMEGMGKS